MEGQAFGGKSSMLSFSEETLEQPVMSATTEREQYQKAVRAAVKNDINRVLSSTKAYVKHLNGPPIISRAKLTNLSAPKAANLHQENKKFKDTPEQYAQYKSRCLQQERAQEEKRQVAREFELEVKNRSLNAYRVYKIQREQVRIEREQQEKEALKSYGRAVATFVANQAKDELEDFKNKNDTIRSIAAQKHLAALSTNFYI